MRFTNTESVGWCFCVCGSQYIFFPNKSEKLQNIMQWCATVCRRMSKEFDLLGSRLVTAVVSVFFRYCLSRSWYLKNTFRVPIWHENPLARLDYESQRQPVNSNLTGWCRYMILQWLTQLFFCFFACSHRAFSVMFMSAELCCLRFQTCCLWVDKNI